MSEIAMKENQKWNQNEMKQYRTKLGNSEIGKKKKTKESNWKPRNVFTSPSWKKKITI